MSKLDSTRHLRRESSPPHHISILKYGTNPQVVPSFFIVYFLKKSFKVLKTRLKKEIYVCSEKVAIVQQIAWREKYPGRYHITTLPSKTFKLRVYYEKVWKFCVDMFVYSIPPCKSVISTYTANISILYFIEISGNWENYRTIIIFNRSHMCVSAFTILFVIVPMVRYEATVSMWANQEVRFVESSPIICYFSICQYISLF